MIESIAFSADLDAPGIALRRPWQWCVGSGHATLALRADWQSHLASARRDLGFRHVRFHGILDDDMGTLICQDDQPLYSFFNTDRIFDFLMSIGMKPVVELSFMPRTLSSGNDIVFHYQGNVTPPRDLDRWAELIRRLGAHWVERYGIDEVATWPFECWNEPNLRAFWTGDQAAYFALYRATAAALKSVDVRLQVGGPVTAGNAWLDAFMADCRTHGTAVDFVSTHYYPTDPFGAIDADTVTQLQHAPADIMRTKALEARASAGSLPLYYSEWSISSNPRDPLHDGSFAAALAARIVMSVDAVVDGYSYWTFSDIFEENYFPSVPYHGGFGMMNLYGVPKPIYRAFEMLAALGEEQLPVTGTHATVAAWVGRHADLLAAGTDVVLINQAMPRHPIDAQPVVLTLSIPAGLVPRGATVARIDDDHANPERAWHAAGAPDYPSPPQVTALMTASTAVAEPLPFRIVGRSLRLEFTVAPQSVNGVHVAWGRA